MEAATLPQKKKLNKGKLKKTIKNVLCRPDPILWPLVTDEHENLLKILLIKYRIPLPELKKLHWNELKIISKDKRPKPPKVEKVDGFLFGISECNNAIQSKQCSAVILEANVNPKLIVQPILETCITTQIPVICLPNLRKISAEHFGIPTTCLGLKINCLADLTNEVLLIAKSYKAPLFDSEMLNQDTISNKNSINIEIPKNTVKTCPYLYRSNKKQRVFRPSEDKINRDFTGENLIEFSNKCTDKNSKYRKMILKRISNNPNRMKGK